MNQILIIDDDEMTRQTLSTALEQSGFQVEVAADGKEGIRKFRSGSFDLAIVDIWMPQKDGLDTLIEIRQHTPNAKVIAISGGGELGITTPLEWAKRLGAVAVLIKPFSIEDLRAAVRKALDSAAN
jgi:DNA-binding response OmpR family regulator